MSSLRIESLHVSVQEKEILKGVDLTLNEGETLALLGPNGHGKSTLLLALMGHPNYKVTSGHVYLDDIDILEKTVDERSRLGLFLAMQSPSEIPGVNSADFLKTAMNARLEKPMSLYSFYSKLQSAYKEMGIPLTQGYGMTECSPRISSSSLKDPSLGLDVGRVVKGCEVEIRDGEIVVKSPSVMQGYYKNEAATKEMFTDDGWLKTGDLGYIEDERIYITGRKKNLIILSNGENISPEQLENYYAGADWLQEVMVYTEDGKITAEAYPYPEYREHAEELFRKTTDEINRKVPPARRITRLRLRDKEFEKTSSRKIRRQQKGEKGRLLS